MFWDSETNLKQIVKAIVSMKNNYLSYYKIKRLLLATHLSSLTII